MAAIILGGVRPCFGQLGASDQLDLRTTGYGGNRSLSAALGVFHLLCLDVTEGDVPSSSMSLSVWLGGVAPMVWPCLAVCVWLPVLARTLDTVSCD